MKNCLIVALCFLSLSSFAGVLTSEPGTQKIEGVGIATAAKLKIKDQEQALTLIGAGLRTKKVVVVTVNVYVAELFSSDASKFVRQDAEALNSLEVSRTIALRMNFLRAVEADKVQVSFRDALVANNVDLKDASVDAFLKAVSAGGEAQEGKSLLVASQKNADGTESVFYEDTTGKLTETKGAAGFSKKIMSIWLGTPSDVGVEKLKASLIKGQ